MVTQLGLFNQAPTLNVLRDLKIAMARAAKETGLSREELCDRINQVADRYGVRLVKGTGQNLTLDSLEKWLNPEDKERVIPAKALSVFCAAVENIEPMQVLVAPLGWRIIDDKQAKLLALAELDRDVKKKKAMMRKLEAEI
jgi:ribosome-binding protein aMBF1 (putative translation factor)